MALTVKRLLEVARGEIGYHEKNSDGNLDLKTAPNDGRGNHTKYARDLYKAGYYNGDKCGYDWCDVFVDWCFYTASGKDKKKAESVECQTGLYGAGVGYSARYYKAQNQFYTTPQVGDQIFFGDNDHTGIVEKIVGNTVYTIEGNTANAMVERRSYSIGSSWIMGYGRPKYDVENNEEESEVRYEKLKDVDIAVYRKTLTKLIDKGIIAGKGGTGDDRVLDLGEDAVRVLVYLDRQGIFG